MLDEYLIFHCSATLAAIKTGSLFSWLGTNGTTLQQQIFDWNRRMCGKGIRLQILRIGKHSVLIYVYRPDRLNADLQQPAVAAFLRMRGYDVSNTELALAHLIKRLSECAQFPHEIGLFLGYPLDDVVGFIENNGKHCKRVGCWKVYGNEQQAVRTFVQYKRCRDVYVRLWKAGRSLAQLTVAV